MPSPRHEAPSSALEPPISTIGPLFWCWQQSLAGLQATIRPINPTPSEIDAPI